jgi:hypothetical protein
VQDELELVDQHRRQRLHALDGLTAADRFEQFAEFGVLCQQDAGPTLHIRGQQQFAAGRRPQPVGRDLQRTLVDDLEVTDLLDLVAPELHAQRVLLGGREDVEDAAAHREVATLLDQVGAGVPGGDKSGDDLGQLAPGVAGPQLDRLELTEPGHLGLQQGPHRRDHNRQRSAGRVIGRRVREPAQHSQPLPDGIGARREAFVRQGLPARVEGHRVRGQQAAQRCEQILGLTAGAGHREDHAFCLPGQSGDRERLHLGRSTDGQLGRPGSLHRCSQRLVGERRIEQSGETHDVLSSSTKVPKPASGGDRSSVPGDARSRCPGTSASVRRRGTLE